MSFYSCANLRWTVYFILKQSTATSFKFLQRTHLFVGNVPPCYCCATVIWSHELAKLCRKSMCGYISHDALNAQYFSHLRAIGPFSSSFLPLREVAEIDVGLHAFKTAGSHIKLMYRATHLNFLCFLKKIW